MTILASKPNEKRIQVDTQNTRSHSDWDLLYSPGDAMSWAWDDLLERKWVEEQYAAQIHQKFIDEHPEFIPGCECHKWTRETRLFLQRENVNG